MTTISIGRTLVLSNEIFLFLSDFTFLLDPNSLARKYYNIRDSVSIFSVAAVLSSKRSV